jgi:exosortase/archaeosortase family protein
MALSAGTLAPPRGRRARSIDPKPLVRPMAAVAIIVVAYHTSLETLLEGLALDTPVAHLALVPLISLLLAFVRRAPRNEPYIHDRQLDWIVGLPLAIGALAVNLLLPARLSTMFWVWRIDLLSFPVFVAGVVALLFGLRTLWRIRAAVLFLFLAWPYPYNQVLDRWLGEFTNLTIAGVRTALRAVPVASPVVGGDGSLFEVLYHEERIRMSVASACSGANGLVGFFLVGLAFILVVEGSKWRKAAWLATGAFLVWLFNIGRIMVVFGAAKAWGESVAIDGFHPYIGLVVFNVAVVLMLAVLRLFGLRLRGTGQAADASRHEGGRPDTYRPHGSTALMSVTVIGLAIAMLNADLRAFDGVSTSLGSPRLTSFAVSRETVPGWNIRDGQRIEWARRFFGKDSTWVRYIYSDTGTGTIRGNLPIYADVIETSNRGSLSAYGIEACYQFHGYTTVGRRSVDLGNGVVGGVLSWTNTDDSTTWTSLWWHWPIKTDKGTRYERVTLLMNDSSNARLSAPHPTSDPGRRLQLGLDDNLRGSDASGLSDRLANSQRFLQTFAQELVQRRSAAPTT